MALPVYTTQDSTTYKSNIDSTASDHNTRIATLEAVNSPQQGYTAFAAASTLDVDLTVPSWVNEIQVLIDGMSPAAAASADIQLGTSASWTTTGYISTLQKVQTSGAGSATSTGFPLVTGAGAANHTGFARMNRLSTGSNVWHFSSSIAQDSANVTYSGFSRVLLAANLTRFRVSATAAFTATGGIGYRYLP